MKWAITIARMLLGLVFFVFGLNGFLGFMPLPEMGAEAGAFMGALGATGYMFPLIKITEVTAGALLLSGRLVPLALVALAPVVLNIFVFHVFLDPAGLPMTVVLTALGSFVAWAYRDSYRSLFVVSSKPVIARANSAGVPATEAA